ncbi:MAG TPA: helix-turn-helix transcriptional regulator [Gaiellaceae bacterium]|nr:helix-turn-helix transcriptional regulator [Gaiellaceae bacterium]
MSPTNPKPNRLRQVREAAGLTQQQLADQVDAGRSTIIRAEQGTQQPTLELANRLADALCTTIDELFSSSDRETLDDAYRRGRLDERHDHARAERVEADTPPDADPRVEGDTRADADPRTARVEGDTPPDADPRVGADTRPDAEPRVEGDTRADADPYREIAAWIAEMVTRKPSAPDRATVWHLDNPRGTKRKLDAIVTVTVQRRPRREADRLFKVEAGVEHDSIDKSA